MELEDTQKQSAEIAGNNSGSEKPVARILLVEDEAIVAQAMSMSIRRHGYEVEAVISGQDGLEKVAREPGKWQLIISDLNMPNMDGIEFITRLRNETSYQGKVAVITGFIAEESMHRLEEVKVDKILPKPIPREELLAALQELLGEK